MNSILGIRAPKMIGNYNKRGHRDVTTRTEPDSTMNEIKGFIEL